MGEEWGKESHRADVCQIASGATRKSSDPTTISLCKEGSNSEFALLWAGDHGCWCGVWHSGRSQQSIRSGRNVWSYQNDTWMGVERGGPLLHLFSAGGMSPWDGQWWTHFWSCLSLCSCRHKHSPQCFYTERKVTSWHSFFDCFSGMCFLNIDLKIRKHQENYRFLHPIVLYNNYNYCKYGPDTVIFCSPLGLSFSFSSSF